RIDLDAFESCGTNETVCFFTLLYFWIHQVLIIAREHFHRVEPSRLKFLDGLRKSVWCLRAAFHPEKGVADVFRVGWATESHVAAFNSSVARKAFRCDAPFFCRMQAPVIGSLLEIRILNVREEERIFGEQVRVALDGVM